MQTALTRTPEAVLVVDELPAGLVVGVLVYVAEKKLVCLLEVCVLAEMDLELSTREDVTAVRVAGVVEDGRDLEDAKKTIPER